MAKKDYINVAEGITKIRALKDDLSNSKAKRNLEKTTNNIKKTYDKLFYYAFYDYRFKVCNYNKLLEDFKTLGVKAKAKLIFIRVPGLVRSAYYDNSKKERINSLISLLKRKIKDDSEKFLFDLVYLIDNYLVLAVDTKYVEEIYYYVKNNKDSFNLDIGVYYVKYNHISSKINKNIDLCIKNAIKVTKEKLYENKQQNQQ